MTRDRDGHESDGSRARDKDVLAQHREGESGVDGVPKRIEDRGDLLVHARPVVPDIGHGQRHEFGEGAIAPHAKADGVGAQVPSSGEAVPASATDHVALAAHEVSGLEVGHIAADLDNLAHELVARDERWLDVLLRPRIPRFDVQVGAADPRLSHTDQHVVDPDDRIGDVEQGEPRAGQGLHQCAHARLLDGQRPGPPGRQSLLSTRSAGTSDQSMTGFSTVPIPSTSQRTRSPGSRNTGGSRNTPTPDGVPVAMRSPGSSVI